MLRIVFLSAPILCVGAGNMLNFTISNTPTTSNYVEQMSETEDHADQIMDQESISARAFIELTLYAIVEDVIKSHRVRNETEPCAYADLHECVTANPALGDSTGEAHPASVPHAHRVRSRAKSTSRAASPADQLAAASAPPAAARTCAVDAFLDVTPLLGGELFLCEGSSAIFLLEGLPSPSAGITTPAPAAVRPPAPPPPAVAPTVGGARPAGAPLTAAQRSWAATVGGRAPAASRRDGGGARFRLDVADVMGPLAG
jgi:hypothetical protein